MKWQEYHGFYSRWLLMDEAKKIGATSITPTFWATDRRWGFPLENNISCLQKPDLLSF
jgi:hypothetical protein